MLDDTPQPPHLGGLSESECWELLHRSGLGRLATAAGGRADIFPVNYLVHEDSVLLRTAPGTKLDQLVEAPEVAFEVDGNDAHRYWSVVIRGRARHLEDQSRITRSGVLELVSWVPTDKHEFIEIIPSSVVGREVERARFGKSSLFG
ncbi:MAG TPA: pyridoxamine 5'-phosphate oxidase family protein [Pseudolysinimonas sp.]|jgi:nitroimidazol reductase NimA-like FMN-containing flavoprotein (pyridoxamine 5'-phosphate oxidase superfamily)|nr:pyridoxamine 5'-phosphate oxidase family protein [Pseudolysinimonas sp.]